MRIAFVLPSLANKAPIRVAYDIVSSLVNSSLVDELVVYYIDDIVELEFPCKTVHLNSWCWSDISKFDIVHSHMLRPDVFVFLGKILGRLAGVRAISTMHQYNYENLKFDYGFFKAFLVSKIWNLALSFFDKVVVLTNHMKSYYSKVSYIKNDNLVCINNGRPDCSPSVTKTLPVSISGKVVIGSVCRIVKVKGLEQCVSLLAKDSSLCFVLLGDGPERVVLENLAGSLGVSDRCFFLGHVDEPMSYVKNFDVCVIPSRSEGFPLSLIEMASVGVPIVCSDLPVFKELFSDDEVAFFELDNISSFYDSVQTALSKRDALSCGIRNKYLSDYTSDIMANKYLNLYKEILRFNS